MHSGSSSQAAAQACSPVQEVPGRIYPSGRTVAVAGSERSLEQKVFGMRAALSARRLLGSLANAAHNRAAYWHFQRESVRTCSPQWVASMITLAMPPTSYAAIASVAAMRF